MSWIKQQHDLHAETPTCLVRVQNLHQSERVQELEGHQGRLSGQVLLLERQNTTLGNKSASLQDMLDATSLKLQEVSVRPGLHSVHL